MTSSRHHQKTVPGREMAGKRGESSKKRMGGKRQTISHLSTLRPEEKNHFSTPARTLDSGYSSGGVVGGRGFNSGGVVGVRSQQARGGKANGGDTAVFTSSPPSLSTPSSVSVPVTLTGLSVTGKTRREEGEGGRVGRGDGVERGRVRQLEHEVAVLEQQLSEKTQAARSHVEELTCMRSELARERAALARVSLTYLSPFKSMLLCATRRSRRCWSRPGLS